MNNKLETKQELLSYFQRVYDALHLVARLTTGYPNDPYKRIAYEQSQRGIGLIVGIQTTIPSEKEMHFIMDELADISLSILICIKQHMNIIDCGLSDATMYLKEFVMDYLNVYL